jgi:hypothetical protein
MRSFGFRRTKHVRGQKPKLVPARIGLEHMAVINRQSHGMNRTRPPKIDAAPYLESKASGFEIEIAHAGSLPIRSKQKMDKRQYLAPLSPDEIEPHACENSVIPTVWWFGELSVITSPTGFGVADLAALGLKDQTQPVGPVVASFNEREGKLKVGACCPAGRSATTPMPTDS